jgi:hypothetical protein
VWINPFIFQETSRRPLGPSQGNVLEAGLGQTGVGGEGLTTGLRASATASAAPGSKIAVNDNRAAGGGEQLGEETSELPPVEEGLSNLLMTDAKAAAAPGSEVAVNDNGAAGGGDSFGEITSEKAPPKTATSRFVEAEAPKTGTSRFVEAEAPKTATSRQEFISGAGGPEGRVGEEGLTTELRTSASVTAAPGSKIAVNDNGAAGGGEHLGKTSSNIKPKIERDDPSGAASPIEAISTTANEEEVGKPKMGPADRQGI